MINEKQYLQDLKQCIDGELNHLQEKDPEELIDLETFNIIKKTVEAEEELRNKHEIGVRFNVLRTQLKGLLDDVAQSININAPKISEVKTENALDADSVLVYVSLFNAQGANIATWAKLLNSQALFEHSVNRPVYASKADIEAMIRAKSNKQQQAFFEVKINKNDILGSKSGEQFKDPLGFPLLRLKQGTLNIKNISDFVHMDKNYLVKEDGSITPIVK